MEWKLTSDELPIQGTKILCFDKGDCWIAQRFQECWFPIPFCDSEFASYKPPEQWCYIEFPWGYDGKIRTYHEESSQWMDMDELERKYPEGFAELKDVMKKAMDGKKIRKEILKEILHDQTTQS